MEPVRFELEDEETGDSLNLKIPKAYLINRPNWSGGRQHIITLKVHVPDLVPWTVYLRQVERGDRLKDDTGSGMDSYIVIHIWNGKGARDGPRVYSQRIARNREPGSEQIAGLKHLRRLCFKEVIGESGKTEKLERLCPSGAEDYFLKPLDSPGPFTSIMCPRNMNGPAPGCEGRTTHNGWWIQYLFSRHRLADWQRINGWLRQLVDGFTAGAQ